jgi:hypothetical protein
MNQIGLYVLTAAIIEVKPDLKPLRVLNKLIIKIF